MLREGVAAALGRESADGGRRWTPRTSDAALAAALTVITQVELALASGVEGSLVVQTLSFAAMTGAVAWRRSFPLGAAAVAALGLAAQTLAGDAEVVGGFLGLAVVTYSVASYAPLLPAALGGALILAAVFLYPFLGEVSVADEVGNAAIFGGTWALGRLVRERQLRAVTAQARLEAAEREHDDRVARILTEERARIARELHDIVAHGVSLMVLQSGAARQTLHRDAAKATELLATAEDQGRQALVEMQRMLGVLRGSDDVAAEQTPTLAGVDRLVEDLRAAGLDATSRVEGDRPRLDAGLELSAYRILQEACTNVVKHADARSVEVGVHYGVDALTLTVRDDGRASGGPPTSGHGLIGMRERAALFGGSLTAGPAVAGGWSVTATLPLGGQP